MEPDLLCQQAAYAARLLLGAARALHADSSSGDRIRAMAMLEESQKVLRQLDKMLLDSQIRLSRKASKERAVIKIAKPSLRRQRNGLMPHGLLDSSRAALTFCTLSAYINEAQYRLGSAG